MKLLGSFSKDLVDVSLSRGRAILDGHRLFSIHKQVAVQSLPNHIYS